MNWETIGNVLFGLGLLALLIGLLLRFRVGRWLLAALWLVLTLGSLLTGDWHSLSDNPNVDTTPQKASRYLLIGGGGGVILGLILRALTSKSI
ncbi:hypothetical protein [Hymenobacter norwichensis]|uniref:hypothetical protein n=1 Tax=Hymenobacter norwichensis TaxID=223903 RepID=UPI0003B7584A|nr:hypothetical protein [Hymenobacter norwichensis]